MSRLDELIAELCPDGVIHLPLEKIAHYAKDRISASDVDADTYVSVENLLQNKMGKTSASSVPTSGNVIGFCKGDILIGNIRPYLRKIWLADCDGGTNGDVLAIQINDRAQISPEFLYYILSSEAFFNYDNQNSKGAKMPRGDKKAVMNYILPVPPLEVQSEIVRILDNFTELTAELAAELTARKQQYEYYKELVFEKYITEETVFGSLNNITDVRDGTHDSPKPSNVGKYLITSKNVKNGTINFDGSYLISEEDFISINARSKVDKWDLLFTMIGTVGEVGLVTDEPDYAIKNVGLIKTNSEILARFLYFFLTTKRVKKYIEDNRSKGSQVFLALGKLRNLPVPKLSEEEMKQIIAIISRFDKLCFDISEGLPAEIEARQKQYEYYRDKLLTFKQLA